MQAATLSGRVTVNDAVYTRPFSIQRRSCSISRRERRRRRRRRQSRPFRCATTSRSPRRQTLQVRNSSVRLVASADLQLRGTFDRPLLFGRAEVDARRVHSSRAGATCITRGTIDFNNPTRIEPFFDLETETRVRVPGETYRVTVRADRPVVAGARVLGRIRRCRSRRSWRCSSATSRRARTSSSVSIRPASRRRSSWCASARPARSPVRSPRKSAASCEQTFGVDTFQITPSLVDPNTQSSRLDPGRACHDRQAAVRPRLSDLLAQPLVVHARPDHPARIRSDGSLSRGSCRATKTGPTRSSCG